MEYFLLHILNICYYDVQNPIELFPQNITRKLWKLITNLKTYKECIYDVLNICSILVTRIQNITAFKVTNYFIHVFKQ